MLYCLCDRPKIFEIYGQPKFLLLLLMFFYIFFLEKTNIRAFKTENYQPKEGEKKRVKKF